MNQQQIVQHKDFQALLSLSNDTLDLWLDAYLTHKATNSESSQAAQRRDFSLFLAFLENHSGGINRQYWTPRATRGFVDSMRSTLNADGSQRWGDRSINRVLAHLKPIAAFIHELQSFTLGNPCEGVKQLSTPSPLLIERALTKQERGHLLDACDELLIVGGRCRDRSRFAGKRPPVRRGYRPYRNRAIVYLLVETGMRRCGAVNLDVSGVDLDAKTITTREKNGSLHPYKISQDGIKALQDYIEHERENDALHWLKSSAFFLPSSSSVKSGGRLSTATVNRAWKEAAQRAGIDPKKTPHSARHAMGVHLIEKTGNPSAVQRQLGHKNGNYSMQYMRIGDKELCYVLDRR